MTKSNTNWQDAQDVKLVKDFLTMEGEFEYDPDTQLEDAALLLDFLSFLRASDYSILKPRSREVILNWFFKRRR
jgi:hypothetical protein